MAVVFNGVMCKMMDGFERQSTKSWREEIDYSSTMGSVIIQNNCRYVVFIYERVVQIHRKEIGFEIQHRLIVF